MYDQSLEQLIDAVIADGVITDQERKVIYKKAAGLGIDQDEIEVYLEGKLDAVKKNAGPKSGKHGVVKTCPNCGATVEGGNAKCPECGYAFTGVDAVSSAKELDKRLRGVSGTGGESDEKRANIISSFPIPNTREDLFEFMASMEPKAFNRYKEGTVTVIGKAYYEKFVEALNKARISFPDDPALKMFEDALKKDKKKIHIHPMGWLLIFMVGSFLMAGISSIGEESKEKDAAQQEAVLSQEYEEWRASVMPEIESYAAELNEKFDMLPTPDVQNYKTCISKVSNLSWTKSWHVPAKYTDVADGDESIYGLEHDMKDSFEERIRSYKKLIGSAWKQSCKQRGLNKWETSDEIPYEYE